MAGSDAVAETIDWKKPEATPSNRRDVRPPFLPVGESNLITQVRRATKGCLQNKVVLKQSTHKPATKPKGAWHATIANGQLIAVEGRNTDKHAASKWPPELEQPPPPWMYNKAPAKAQRQVPLRDQSTRSGASNAASTNASILSRDCPKTRLTKLKAEVDPYSWEKAASVRPDVQRLSMQLGTRAEPTINIWKLS